jgi:DNA-binding ferritin-like protein
VNDSDANEETMNATCDVAVSETSENNIDVLRGVESALLDLFARIKQAQWSLPGTSEAHKMLGEFSIGILKHIDLVEERATVVGGFTSGASSEISPPSGPKRHASISNGWMRELADAHLSTCQEVRRAIIKMIASEDFGTADLLTKLWSDLDLQLWRLKARINEQINPTT